MKQSANGKLRKNGYQSDDDNIRYKLNTKIFESNPKTSKSRKNTFINDDDNVRYKLPSAPIHKPKPVERKLKPKPKIKVNFWSNKQTNRVTKPEVRKEHSYQRHTIDGSTNELKIKPKSPVVKVLRKQVSFLPSPLFSENHIPMVTVPDDLTIQLNEEEANDLAKDLNLAFVNSQLEEKSIENSNRKARATTNQSSPRGAKRKRNSEDTSPRSQGNNNELEFFSKYVVQKLRRMETNQRIYSENLINTVLMLGQLGKLNGKSKISEV